APRAPDIRFDGVSVVAAGHTILQDVDLHVRPKSHVAIVGTSGAGKSSLVGTLLGWLRPASGTIRIDGAPIDRSILARLRRHTAWIDPSVPLWNRSLFDNLRYGSNELPADFGAVLDGSTLRETLEGLPDGLQTVLGEGGALVSGGEGQRVRFARAL